MCGRYVITKPITKTKDLVKTNIKVDDKDNYNAHPAQKLPIIKSYTNGKALENYEWGLFPSWAKEKKDFKPLINARLETLMEKISFKKLIQTSRCLIVADGYYEWQRENKEKTPYYFTKADNGLMFFAGIYQNNQFCIITKEASGIVKNIHHREPLIINDEQILNYLNIKKEGMNTLLSIKSPELKFHEVSKDVNKPINNDSSLINPKI
jgi:putative SOS response-associated peptidase YedK|tara:strand:+ start:144 stop:770 length:627 start_codon:yes stop_codon:yes gene_type:complete